MAVRIFISVVIKKVDTNINFKINEMEEL